MGQTRARATATTRAGGIESEAKQKKSLSDATDATDITRRTAKAVAEPESGESADYRSIWKRYTTWKQFRLDHEGKVKERPRCKITESCSSGTDTG